MQMGRPMTVSVSASSSASAFTGSAVAARVKRSARAARVQSRRTAVMTKAKASSFSRLSSVGLPVASPASSLLRLIAKPACADWRQPG